MSTSDRILVIVTNVAEYEHVGMRTGLWLGELTHFWDYAEQAGFTLEIASPRGGWVPIDPESLAHDVLSELGTDRRYQDRVFMSLLRETRKVADVDVGDYDAIYLTGGHGVMFDFPRSRELEALVARFHDTGRVVSAVCHGPCGLLGVPLESGLPLVGGRRVTGFSWPEEVLANREGAVPYSLQDQLTKLGADYQVGSEPFAAHVVTDGRLITGQNPASARGVAEAVVAALRA